MYIYKGINKYLRIYLHKGIINYVRKKTYISPWNIRYFNEIVNNYYANNTQIWSSIYTYILSYIHIHACRYTYIQTLHPWIYIYITPIYTCILTKHKYMYKYILPYVNMYIHIHKYITYYIYKYMHTYICNYTHNYMQMHIYIPNTKNIHK